MGCCSHRTKKVTNVGDVHGGGAAEMGLPPGQEIFPAILATGLPRSAVQAESFTQALRTLGQLQH